MSEPLPGFVYFIADGEFIKIGWAANPLTRMRSLETANPRTLVLLGVIIGGQRQEQALHRRFGRERHRGEWFTSSPRLLAFIAKRSSPFTTQRIGSALALKKANASDVRRISAALDCSPLTVTRVLDNRAPGSFPVSRRIYQMLVSDGFLKEERQ